MVLIIGAGPTGLMMACQLSRFGIPFRIIEKNSGPSEKSKAIVVQSRTLEIYDQMCIADDAVNEGHSVNAMNFFVKGKIVQRIPFNNAGKDLSPFPFLHIFEQNKNEALLLEYLAERNIKVEWNTELLSLTQDENSAACIISKEGNQETVFSSWLVGADGGHSTVRHQLNVPFLGDAYENIFYVADTALEWNLCYNELVLYLSKKTFTGFFPMKGRKRFRLVGILPERFKDEKDVAFDDIKEVITSELDLKIDFKDTNWFSVYRLHHRCVNQFRIGRCFLAGDAAHIHSPAGGQGMNTGLQDSYNLAWKIALVERNIADKKILDSYNAERLPFARKLVKTTDRVFTLAVTKNNYAKFLRLNIIPVLARVLMGINSIRTFVFKTVSQISINYIKSPLSKDDRSSLFISSFLNKRIHAGDRVPYCHFDSEEKVNISIYDILKDPCFHILIFDRLNKWNNVDALKNVFNKNALIKIIFIQLNEENKAVYFKFGVRNSMVCIIRPDNYIGYLSDSISIKNIQKYFRENLLFDI